MDKKIGIMSMQRIINYGSFLQAYGLKKMIESISKSEVEFVDYRFGTDITDRLKRKQERTESVMDKVLKNRTPWNYLKKMQFFKEIERRLIQDLKEMGVDELNYDCRVDTLVIGSDEVFNCLQPYPVGYSKQLFGDGFEGNKLVSYAASFGSTRYEDLVETGIVQEIKTMLSKFAAISVRDENSAHIVKQLLGYDPEIHMDPVLMYDFAQEIAEYKTSEKDYIILYAYTGRLSREEECYIKKFANAVSYKLPTLVSTLTGIFNQAWSYSAIREEGTSDETEYNNKMFKTLSAIAFMMGIGLLLLTKPFLGVYVADSYYDAWKYTPFLIIGCVYLTLGTFMATSYTVHKDSFGYLFSGSFGAAFNILLNFILIPVIGVYGAALATCISYIAVFMFRVFHTRKYIKYDIMYKEFILGSLLMLVSAILMFVDGMKGFLLQLVILLIGFTVFSKTWIPMLQFFLNKIQRKRVS